MSVATLIAQFTSLTEKAEKIGDRIGDSTLQHTDEQYDALKGICFRLHKISGNILRTIRRAETAKAERQREYLSSIETSREDLVASGNVNNLTTFRRNMYLFFEGPKDSNFDTPQTRARKSVTRNRCERIRCMDPDGIIVFAASFPPVVWAGGAMSNEQFNFLFNHIAPEETQAWSSAIMQTLGTLAIQEPLLRSKEFGQFLKSEVYVAWISHPTLTEISGSRYVPDQTETSGQTYDYWSPAEFSPSRRR